MKFSIFFVIVLLLSQNKVYSQNLITNDIPETKQETLFDIYKTLKIISNSDSTWTEQCKRKIPKKRIIFRKGKTYHYKAIYTGSNNDTLSNSFVYMKTTGERWEGQPESQDLVYYEFADYKADSIRLSNHFINKKCQSWTRETGEGVTENIEWVWIHPIRANQYKFTEVAPFPEVLLPLQKRKKWVNMTNGIKGWGEWDGQTVKNKYKITGKTFYQMGGITIDCWIIKSVAKWQSGKSKLITLFNEDYGFVKMDYQNYGNEKLVFILIDVEEK